MYRGKTPELLESLGYSIAFIGTKSGDPKVVAEEFKAWLGDRQVLFPVSDRSLKTISSHIDDDQKQELVTYSTEVIGMEVEACDIYVFTSPSNVEGFFVMNELPPSAKVLAWGKSSESALGLKGVEVVKCLENSKIESLIEHLSES